MKDMVDVRLSVVCSCFYFIGSLFFVIVSWVLLFWFFVLKLVVWWFLLVILWCVLVFLVLWFMGFIVVIIYRSCMGSKEFVYIIEFEFEWVEKV